MMNIYDLEGNYSEYTTEAGSTFRRVTRGGNYDRAKPSVWYSASTRLYGFPNYSDSISSARPTLYVNL